MKLIYKIPYMQKIPKRDFFMDTIIEIINAIIKMDKKGKCPWWEYKEESKK